MAGAVTKADLPTNSLLQAYIVDGDFMDCYSCSTSLEVDEATQVALTFPGWARMLLVMRNAIVAPLGLSTTLPESGEIPYFPIDKRADNEIVVGFDDSHLNFRISILVNEGVAYGATWVHRNNFLGRAYLKIIMPFHVLIMRNAMARVADNQIEDNTAGKIA